MVAPTRRKRGRTARGVASSFLFGLAAALSFVRRSPCCVAAFSPSMMSRGACGGGMRRMRRPLPTVPASPRFPTGLLSAEESNEDTEESSDDSPVSDGDDEVEKEELSAAEAGVDSGEGNNDPEASTATNAFSRWRRRLFGGGGGGMKFDKASIAKLGVSMVLSYGFVSNVSGCVCVSICWFLFSKQTGLSPLAPGQWPKFLAYYAGFFAFLNVVRPARFALSVALNRYFDRIMKYFQEKFQCSRARATFLVGFLVNFCGSWGIIAVGVSIASALSGVPVWAGR